MSKSTRAFWIGVALTAFPIHSAQAIVEVESFIKPIEDIGVCDPNAGIYDKCGFNDYPVPVLDSQVNAYDDGRGAHETVGTIRFSAEYGQQNSVLGAACSGGSGVSDNGDWDIPNRLFTCVDGSTHASAASIDLWGGGVGLAPYDVGLLTGCAAHPDGLDDSEAFCGVAPDATGRLDSLSCTDGANYTCAINADGYSFFNYLACYPTLDCFKQDPLLASTCDNFGGGPFSQPDPFQPPHDLWIAGTHLNLRLPYGARLGNTIYPGVLLNGDNQFDFDEPTLSVRQNPTKNYSPAGLVDASFAWPAVVKSFEANHVVAHSGQSPLPCPGAPGDSGTTGPDPLYPLRCAGRFSDYDKIVVFVPDILTAIDTDSGNPSVFLIGEQVVQGPLIPPSRTLVDNCYVKDASCIGPGLGVDGDILSEACDYDTSISVDIRGSVPAMRPAHPVPYARIMEFDLEVSSSSQTDFIDQSPQVATVVRRSTTAPTIASTPAFYPYCNGFDFCFVRDGAAYPESGAGATQWLHLPSAYSGQVTLTEPWPGFISADAGPGTATPPNLICRPSAADSGGFDQTAWVDFVYEDSSVTSSTPNGVCSLLGQPEAPPTGNTDVSIQPGTSTMTGFFPPNRLENDAIGYRLLSESTADPASIALSGYEMLIADDAPMLVGGSGCVELDCDVRFPDEAPNHEGVANSDSDGLTHLPASEKIFSFTQIPVACLGPGQASASPPYCVFCETDADCSDSDFCNGMEICDPLTGCWSGTPPVCDDGDVCNGIESCDPALGCQPGAPLGCDNGDYCDGVETCDAITGCQSGTPIVCDDGVSCTDDLCIPANGACDHPPLGWPCVSAPNFISDADNNGILEMTDAVLTQSAILQIVPDTSISPLALLDGDLDLDLRDLLLAGQHIRIGLPDLTGPNDLLSVSSTGNFSTAHGLGPIPVFWTVASNLIGTARQTENLAVTVAIVTQGVESQLQNVDATVQPAGVVYAEFVPLNTTGSSQFVTFELGVQIYDSDGSTLVESHASPITALVGP